MMTLPKSMIVCIAFTIGHAACGPEQAAPKDRAFDNPSDPARDQPKAEPNSATEGEKAKAAAKADSASGVKTNGKDPGSDTQNKGLCLAGRCAPIAGSEFNFATTVAVTPDACSAISDLKVFENGNNLIAFFIGTCFGVTQLRSALVRDMATPVDSMIISDCGKSVRNIAVEAGPAGYLVAYSCDSYYSANYTYFPGTLRAVPVKADGSRGTAQTIDNNYYYYSDLLSLKWNGPAAAYMLARAGWAQRLSESGAMVGGPVTLPSKTNVQQLVAIDGSWILMQEDYCNRVSTGGVLECNQVPTKGGVKAILGSDKAFKTTVSQSWGQTSVAVVDFSASTCNLGAVLSVDSLGENGGSILMVYGGLSLSADLGVALAKGNDSLYVSAFAKRPDRMQVFADSPVAAAADVSSANILKAQGKLAVSFVKKGTGFVAKSVESIP